MARFGHYTTYQPKPFTKKERETVTILYGGLTWKHERILQGVFHNLHYNAQPLPNVSRADLEAGKELVDVGACCPTAFTTGNLVNYIKSAVQTHGKEEVVSRYAYLTAGNCGACRFGQYHQSYTMALEAIGLSDFRILLAAQDRLDQGAVKGNGLELSMPFTTGVVWALLCGDLLIDLEYMIRPYEVIPGQTDRVVKESVEYLYEGFRNRPVAKGKWRALLWHLHTGYFTNALQAVYRKFEAIEVDRLRVKPKVKITGEFWLQTHEGDGNYNIKRWLEQEGAEVIPPPIAVWFDYWIRWYVQGLEDRREVDPFALLKIAAVKALQRVFQSTYNRLRKAVGYLPAELPNQYELARLAAPYYHSRLSGGEGDMLVGKALYAYHRKLAHMICELSPYSCMPNTMSIGAMANVLGKYPDLLYAAIEVKGDAEVHALSRCQMVLTGAKKRAQSEYQEALARTGLNEEKIRMYLDAHPEMKKATYRIPRDGVCGTAASLLLYVAERMKKTNPSSAAQ
jgi:predicted nucleotide-binding protein (sugar kinase/HSP70/actin superfamily)